MPASLSERDSRWQSCRQAVCEGFQGCKNKTCDSVKRQCQCRDYADSKYVCLLHCLALCMYMCDQLSDACGPVQRSGRVKLKDTLTSSTVLSSPTQPEPPPMK